MKRGTELQSRVQQSVQQLHFAAENVAGARSQLSQLQAMSNPYSAAVQQLQRQLTAQQQDLEVRQQQQAELEGKVGCPACCLFDCGLNRDKGVVQCLLPRLVAKL